MAVVTVEVADLAAASRDLARTVADPLFDGVRTALGGVQNGGGMAGDDPGGRSWSSSYDDAAPAAITAAEDVINACYRVSTMLGASARNYAHAELASTTHSHAGDSGLTAALTGLPTDEQVVLQFSVPSASVGAHSGGGPPGWHFIAHHLGGYVWPNGHQDRLREVARAWHASARVLDDHAFDLIVVDLGPLRDRLPEGEHIATVCNALYEHVQGVARAHRGLGDACSQLAAHIDHAHTRVEHELAELVAWTAGIQTVGAVASVASFGAAEAPTQAGQAARIASTVSAVIGILRDFVAAVNALLAGLGPIADAMTSTRAALAWLKDLRIVQVEVTAVPGMRVYQVARVERAGSEVSAATEVATGEETALEELASESQVVPTPRVTSDRLNNIVKDLYKGTKNKNAVGNGTTSSAIRHEHETGLPTNGTFHTRKGHQYVRALKRWLRENPDASPGDKLVARSLLRDLQSALAGD